mgnify:FL=1
MLVGDIGKDIEVTVMEDGAVLNISTATTKELIFTHADGTTKTFAAAFVGTGTDGKIKYTTVLTSDFDKPGRWQVQWHVIVGSRNIKGEAKGFVVDYLI